MRALLGGVLLMLGAFPAAAQSSGAAPLLHLGTSVRYRPHADSGWVAGRVVMIAGCLALAASDELGAAAAQGGFSATFLSSVDAVEIRRDTSWVGVPAAELSALRACKPGS